MTSGTHECNENGRTLCCVGREGLLPWAVDFLRQGPRLRELVKNFACLATLAINCPQRLHVCVHVKLAGRNELSSRFANESEKRAAKLSRKATAAAVEAGERRKQRTRAATENPPEWSSKPGEWARSKT